MNWRRRVRTGVVITAGALSVSACSAAMSTRTPTTVIVVRHADRASVPPADPPLTELGEARARDLATTLRDAGVQVIITTQFGRTKATAAPLAHILGIVPLELPDTGAAPARMVAREILERHPGETVLVIGHGHTVPDIVAALGASLPSAICETVFDQIFVVTVPRQGAARLVQARYGAPSIPDPACSATK